MQKTQKRIPSMKTKNRKKKLFNGALAFKIQSLPIARKPSPYILMYECMISRIKMALKLLEVIPCDFKGCVGHLKQ